MNDLPGFKDITPLGSGGLGDVYVAVRTSTGARVAIKVLRDWSDQSLAAKRALRELKALAELRGHPNVVQLEDVIDHEGVPHLIMEYAERGSVAEMQEARGGRLAIGEVVLVGEHTARALADLHRRGIVHLDIKPQNLLIGAYGQVKVCDFGISTLLRSEEFRERTRAVSYRYASPEQLNDAEVGAPADVYALGATLIHLATGTPAPVGGSHTAAPLTLLDIPRPVTLPAAVLDRFERLVVLMVATDPWRRPTAETVAAELEGMSLGMGEHRRRTIDPTAPAPIVAYAPRQPAPSPRPPVPPRPADPAPSARPVVQPSAPPTARRPTGATPARSSTTRPPLVGRVRPRRASPMLAVVAFVLLAGAVVSWAVVALRARDDATTTTTAAPSVGGAAPSARDVASFELQSQRNADEATVEALVGSWVAQVSAKQEGLEVGGVVYDLPAVLADHQRYRRDYGAVLLWSGDYVFQRQNFWITIVPIGYATADEALAWCEAHGLPDGDDCFAKLITHDQSIDPAATTEYEPS